ncbi:alpha/beta hydrolase [Lentzea flaviverrucosa]|uniref:Acetyl esterase/lipase n=1 Tax=Lentzea flaviverrucosa TaxID=200379 RepID=A0A1H9GDK9_9PSEU|nr:alpha/beta hydrolase [Lentzea flaviverrucosa]RDI34940.1 acetyl esterase/lipase [Lentzea flaviverrucosa]SEQ48170.1 Acetyl esterase/lipase [Lentzea flaviverrucosa]
MIDPEIAAAVDFSLPPLTAAGIAERRSSGRIVTDAELTRGGTVTFSEEDADGVPVLVLRPSGSTGPPVLHVHGGGMVAGTRRSDLHVLAEWVSELGVTLVSPEYRLAPEHPHPAPVRDCYRTLTWMTRNGLASPVVAGTSAGGGLAAAVTLMARDLGGPDVRGQLLMCPMLDDRCETPSSHQFLDGTTWVRASNLTGWTALLGDARGGPDVSPYAAPARAAELAGLPPAYVDVGSVDVFRDEAVGYASRIWQAGGDAELHVWPGGCHGFDQLVPEAALSRRARATRMAWLRRTLYL